MTLNGRTLEEYFPNKLHQQLITDPFTVLELAGSYDVVAKITGGGPSGQAVIGRAADRQIRHGADGVRGLANRELTADLALGLAQAAAAVLTQGRHADELRAAGRRPTAVVARDPRVSGEFLTAAVAAGLASSGVDVLDAGVIPTPATAFLIDSIHADFGVMISASHNPMPDNGIKIFGPGGHKLDDATEDRIEELVNQGPGARPTGAGIGRVIEEIRGILATISAAVEEQSAATRDASSRIAHVSDLATRSNAAATTLTQAASRVDDSGTALRGAIDRFLEEARRL